MDQGPFRMPRPADRNADQEKPAEEPKRSTSESRSSRVSSPYASKSESKLSKSWIIGIVVVLVLVIGIGGWALTRNGSTGSVGGSSVVDIDSSKYQAVFFTNGQVYFGKLQSVNSDYMKLTDIFYLQTQSDTSNPQKTSSENSSSDVQLVKLGNEIHGPSDEMVISKNQVLFFENLKSDGKVAQSIANYQQGKK